MGDAEDNLDLGLAKWLVALLSAITGAAFVFWGLRSVHGYVTGSPEAWASPTNGVIGLLGGAWMLTTAARLARDRSSHPLVMPQTELLIYSVLAFAGGVWMLLLDVALPRGLVLPAAGVLGCILWWRRRRALALRGSSA